MSFHWIFWHWWILTAIFLTLEILAPGAFFLWIGAAAAATGLLAWLIPSMTWEIQTIIFSLLSMISIVLSRTILKKNPIISENPTLNVRAQQYVGRTFSLTEAIINGTGKIRVDDASWKVRGKDCPMNTLVKVVGVDNTFLLVEPVEEN